MNNPHIYIAIDKVRNEGRLDYHGQALGNLSINYRADDYWVLRASSNGTGYSRTPVVYYLFYVFNGKEGERDQLMGECLIENTPGSKWAAATAHLRAEAEYLAKKALRLATSGAEKP